MKTLIVILALLMAGCASGPKAPPLPPMPPAQPQARVQLQAVEPTPPKMPKGLRWDAHHQSEFINLVIDGSPNLVDWRRIVTVPGGSTEYLFENLPYPVEFYRVGAEWAEDGLKRWKEYVKEKTVIEVDDMDSDVED